MFIRHSDGTKFVPRYYKKVPLGGDKYRYFYSKKEYDAYIDGQATQLKVNSMKRATQVNKTNDKTTNSSLSKLIDKITPWDTKREKEAAEQEAARQKLLKQEAKQEKQQQLKNRNNAAHERATQKVAEEKAKQEAAKSAAERSTGGRSGKGSRTTETNKQDSTEQKEESSFWDKITPWDTKKEKQAKELAKEKALLKENYNDLLNAGFKAKTTETTDMQDMALINPNYYEDYKYTVNCPMCTLAYELRQRGFDVEAMPNTDMMGDEKTIASWFGIDESEFVGVNRQTSSIIFELVMQGDIAKYSGEITKDNESAVADFVEKDILEKYGEGCRGTFSVNWRNASTGHIMAWEIVNGKVEIRCSQTNKIFTVEEIVQRSSAVNYYRTDNREIDPSVINKYVKNRGV